MDEIRGEGLLQNVSESLFSSRYGRENRTTHPNILLVLIWSQLLASSLIHSQGSHGSSKLMRVLKLSFFKNKFPKILKFSKNLYGFVRSP